MKCLEYNRYGRRDRSGVGDTNLCPCVTGFIIYQGGNVIRQSLSPVPGSHKAHSLLTFQWPQVGHLWKQEVWPKHPSSLLETELEEGPLGPSVPVVCWWNFGGERRGT